MMKVNKMNRMARKELADSRAMEEQMERENPLSGSGATPSMGLSQVRGGAAAQGKMLREHLVSLHGAGYAKEFCGGMRSRSPSPKPMKAGLHTGAYEGEGKMKGGFAGFAASLALPLIASMLGSGKMSQEAHDEMKEMIEEHEKKYHGKKLKGGFVGMLASLAIPLVAKLLGAGKMTKGAANKLMKLFKEDSVPVEGAGRAVGAGTGGMVGCGNGRSRRAELVRKVMADRGCGMIEASKIVKSEGMK